MYTHICTCRTHNVGVPLGNVISKVADVSFARSITMLSLIILQLELFFYSTVKNFILFVKTLSASPKQPKSILNNSTTNPMLPLAWLTLLALMLKPNYAENLYFSGVIIYLLLFSTLNFYYKSTNSRSISISGLSLFFLTYTLIFQCINTLLDFFLLVEFYGVIYFFFFCYNSGDNIQSIKQYKKTILLLIWNNFLTSLLLIISLYFLISKSGTVNFGEMYTLKACSTHLFIFLVGLFWKLGLPMFHFFKYELYYYLDREFIFMFSILTTIINSNLIIFLLGQDIFIFTLLKHNLLWFVLVSLINLMFSFLKSPNILHYLATSGIITITLVLLIVNAL